ncbi:MAG TPA: hypothetical protein VG267_21895 [Terracidiphilus sp.]|nr:hypothetical protein [Terracidiphilus sp.]
MNLTQMHERLRLELLRRIGRGSLSISLLSRQTGFGAAHLSNFLHSKRRLSLEGIDRILAAQHLTAMDLLPAPPGAWTDGEQGASVPVVSHETAMHEPIVRRSAVQQLLSIPDSVLRAARSRSGPARKSWLRFVAIHIGAADAAAMDPLILPDALVVLDRHYTSLAQYRPDRRNIYAVHHELRLVLRYADFQASRIVLRPHNRDVPVELAELVGDQSPGDLIAGRVLAVLNQT